MVSLAFSCTFCATDLRLKLSARAVVQWGEKIHCNERAYFSSKTGPKVSFVFFFTGFCVVFSRALPRAIMGGELNGPGVVHSISISPDASLIASGGKEAHQQSENVRKVILIVIPCFIWTMGFHHCLAVDFRWSSGVQATVARQSWNYGISRRVSFFMHLADKDRSIC